MPVEITERYMDPGDPDDHLAQLAAGRGAPASFAESSLWVEPDYGSIPGDADVPVAEEERRLVWPGPAMIMPAGLLPDGQPHSRNERENATRICGREVRDGAEADAVVWAYWSQQNALRDGAGLPRPMRGARGVLEDQPETLRAIEQLHREERARRERRHGHAAD